MEDEIKPMNVSQDDNTPREFGYDYIKSGSFRVVHADGVWGGLTPKGKIAVGFFNERPPIPTSAYYPIEGPHKIGAEITSKREGRQNAIREMEVMAIMDITLAKSVYEWLGDHIKSAENALRDED